MIKYFVALLLVLTLQTTAMSLDEPPIWLDSPYRIFYRVSSVGASLNYIEDLLDDVQFEEKEYILSEIAFIKMILNQPTMLE